MFEVSFPWIAPWKPISAELSRSLTEEFRREAPAGHALFDRNVVAIGRREGCDDVLFYLGESKPRFAVVQLTYHQETLPEWPFTTLYETVEDWMETCIRIEN